MTVTFKPLRCFTIRHHDEAVATLGSILTAAKAGSNSASDKLVEVRGESCSL